MNNFNTVINLNASREKVFHALTHGIASWWTEMFEDSADKHDSIFTVRFGENVYKTMRVELVNDSKIIWHVTDSLINVPGLTNQREWIGTSIVWEIMPHVPGAQLKLTHIGLQPNIECYAICISGWQQFTDSLKSFLETGTGSPFKK